MIPKNLLELGLLADPLRQEVVAGVTAELPRIPFLDPDHQSLGFRSAVRRMPENTLRNRRPLRRQHRRLDQWAGTGGISNALHQREGHQLVSANGGERELGRLAQDQVRVIHAGAAGFEIDLFPPRSAYRL